ncbi:formin-like protein 7 isoform X2 [Rosa chinensis]|uniref:formin-like protein 7 isoform X2 n=1 Tax=Rosa chinensis TaxID=74649 RepID=UPI001AD8A66D|nr:formin-like protein 7 isoform X2 [Rosa chinensis]
MPPANQQRPPPPLHFHFQQGSLAPPAPPNVVQQAIGQQGPYLYQTPMPPANQQRPPPPLHFHFQQGSRAAPVPPNVVQQAIYAVPPPIGQQGRYLYQHGFVAPPLPTHQSSSVPFSGMPNTGQSYGHPVPPVHGSTWHNMQHSSTAGNWNFQRIHPPALVTPHAPPYPYMSKAAVPHGALPPSNNTTSGCAAQGPTWCRALYPAQPQAGLQHNPPPPPASIIVNPTSLGTSGHLTAGASEMASLALLPAANPQSPFAPLPTAPSPSTSLPKLDAFSFPSHPHIDRRSNKLLLTETRPLNASDMEIEDPLIRIFSADRGLLIEITNSKCPQSHEELSLSQNKKMKKKKKKKKKKRCKTPETNIKSCESPSIQPQLVQVTDQEVEMPQDLSFSAKNKKSCKLLDCSMEVCDVSVGTSVMESNMPAVDPYIQPSMEQLVVQPLVEGMSTTTNSKSPKPNADFGCLQETKKKKQKRSHKTNENKELPVETMMPEADPSFQRSFAMFSEQELEVSQPLNVDAGPLVEGMSRTLNPEKPRLNADFNCSQETKKKKRKREILMEPMMPEAESSLQPSLTISLNKY